MIEYKVKENFKFELGQTVFYKRSCHRQKGIVTRRCKNYLKQKDGYEINFRGYWIEEDLLNSDPWLAEFMEIADETDYCELIFKNKEEYE